MSFWPLHMHILITSLIKIPWPFSNYPSLKTFEGCNCENMENVHWKLMTFEIQYRFAYISATKARIFMKFDTYICKTIKIYRKIFCKDLCTHTLTRDVNVRDICKTILTLKNHQFSMYFAYFHSYAPRKPWKMYNYETILDFFWKLDIKMSQSNE